MSYNKLRQIRRERAAAERLAPLNRDGHLYYVKLKTQYGPLYKLGFTKSSSVQERFSYGGSTNHELIDTELLFIHLQDAYDIEARLHAYFRRDKAFGMFSSKANMPLYKSGQGELYYKDVLKLDASYSRTKHFTTWIKILYSQGKAEYKSGMLVMLTMVFIFFASLAFLPIVILLSWAADRLNGVDSKRSEEQRKKSLSQRDADIERLIANLVEQYSQQKLKTIRDAR